MKVLSSSKLTDRRSWVLLTSRWDTVGFPHVINYLFPFLQVIEKYLSKCTFFFLCVLYLDHTSLKSTQFSWWDILQILCGIFFLFLLLLSSGEIMHLSLPELPQDHTTTGRFKQEYKLKKANCVATKDWALDNNLGCTYRHSKKSPNI